MLLLILVSRLAGAVVSGNKTSRPAVLRLPLRRFTKNATLSKRNTEAVLPLWNKQPYYKMAFELGTPPQLLEVAIDTGSSDFILVSDNINDINPVPPGAPKRFDELSSTTYTGNDTVFDITYDDSTNYLGEWGQDVFSVNGFKIPNFNFGLAFITNSPNEMTGGIGLAVAETAYFHGAIDTPYANFPMQLKEHGIINHIAYSIWLNNGNEPLGLIEFGGMDLSLTESSLYRFPIVNSIHKSKNLLAIKLNEIYLVDSNMHHQILAETSLPMVLDTGTYLSRLPKRIIKKLCDAFGATKHDGDYAVPCRRLERFGGGISLVFSGVEFMFSFNDISIAIEGTDLCIPGFLVSDSPVIGENIFRSLYAVFDLENLEIGIAVANTKVSTNPGQPIEITETIVGTKAPQYSSSDIDFEITVYDVTYRPKTWSEISENMTVVDTFLQNYVTLGSI